MFLRLFLLSLLSCVIAISVAGTATGASATAAAKLDGQVFEGVLREADKQTGGDPDRLVFDSGVFTSQACESYGFSGATYSVEEAPDEVRFSAVLTSPSHGEMTWQGTVRGNQLKASVTWVKERWYWSIRREYLYEGELVPSHGEGGR